MKHVLVIGGGAAGLTAAISAAESGAQVTLLEKNTSVGKKILITGNGKCNLSNRNMEFDNYHTETPDEQKRFCQMLNVDDTVSFFERIGLYVKARNGYLYPMSGQASSVVESLLQRAEELGVNIVYSCSVRGIQKSEEKFIVKTTGGEYTSDAVILCTGGKAASKTGSSGDGYYYAKQLGHTYIETVPALSQLKCAEHYFKEIAGVRMDAKVSVKSGNAVYSNVGEVQITEYGISGIPVFQISRFVNYRLLNEKNVSVTLDFFPEIERNGFEEKMYKKRNHLLKNRTAEAYFNGILHKKIMSLLMKLAGIDKNSDINTVQKERILFCYSLMRDFNVTVIDNTGFENAQVTAGGIPISEISETMESMKTKGFYLAGEILDIDGDCGGYNLQWAWNSGITAGKNAAKEG